LWHKNTFSPSDFDLVVLPGGFSYGDYLRSGAVSAVSVVMQSVREFARNGGLTLGICNGFQILCESGLLCGALLRNAGLTFLCQDVSLKVESRESPWTNAFLADSPICLPIAHGDGRFVASASEIDELKRSARVLLTYVTNPNGSAGDIAGICNQERNVFGLMPHPERATDLGSRDGMKVWRSISQFLMRSGQNP
jgi:phosphoribosylformylglycinamidine synthase